MNTTDTESSVQPRFVPLGERTGDEGPEVVFVVDVRTLGPSEHVVARNLRRSLVITGGPLASFPETPTIDIEFAEDAAFFDSAPFLVLADVDFMSDDIPVSAGRRAVVSVRGSAVARYEPVVHVRNCREMDAGFVESCFLEVAHASEVVVEDCHLTSSSPCFRWLPSEPGGVARIRAARIVLRGDTGTVVETDTRTTLFSSTTVHASRASAPFGENVSVVGGRYVLGDTAGCFGVCTWKPDPPESPAERTFPGVTQTFLLGLVRGLCRPAQVREDSPGRAGD